MVKAEQVKNAMGSEQENFIHGCVTGNLGLGGGNLRERLHPVGNSGDSAERHKEFALRQLRDAAEHAGITVSEAPGGDTEANVEIVFLDTTTLQPLKTNELVMIPRHKSKL